MSQELHLVDVADILKMARGSVDFPEMGEDLDWLAIFADKVAHDHFDAIVDEIRDNGFGMPIVLVDRGEGRWVLGNGHHRLCAAILLGLWRIPVLFSHGTERADFMCEESMDDDTRPIFADSTIGEYWSLMREYLDAHPLGYCESCGQSNVQEHLVACYVRGMDEVSYCAECDEWRYHESLCACLMGKVHEEALVEDNRRNVPMGAVHPISIVEEAYAEDAEWEADRGLREARIAYEAELEVFRAMRNDGRNTFALVRQADRVQRANLQWQGM